MIRNHFNVFLLILVCFFSFISVSPCKSEKITKGDYKGDGKFFVKVRDYGIGKTYGYDLQFDTFFLNNNTVKKYNLTNLPISKFYRNEYKINFEISIGVPKSRNDLDRIVQRSNNMPKEHAISYTLKNATSGEIIISGKKNIYELEPTHHREYNAFGLLHIKNLFDLDMNLIKPKNKLEFEIEYTINGKPTDDEVYIFITLMAPTA